MTFPGQARVAAAARASAISGPSILVAELALVAVRLGTRQHDEGDGGGDEEEGVGEQIHGVPAATIFAGLLKKV